VKASHFVPPPRRSFPPWARVVSLVPLYAIGWPIVKGLELLGVWPKLIGRRRPEHNGAFGNYRPSPRDVFVCSYFKAGTTWTLQIATQIAFRGDGEFDNIHHAVPWPDVPAPVLARHMISLDDPSPAQLSPSGLRVIKTHLTKAHVPFTREARYIAVTRDPKDCCVSGYRFLQAMAFGPLMPSVDRWVDFMFSSDFPDPWAEHLAGYWALRHEPNVLFLMYEHLQKDHAGSVRRIAEFMGVELTASELATVVEQSSFTEMKAAGGRFEPGRIVPWSAERAMMRRGSSGGSSELLTPAQQQRIDDYCRAELERLGCDFPYDAAYGCSTPGTAKPQPSAASG
jgi:aryl sulfotransferase